QPAGRNPGAGRELEILGDATVEHQTLAGICRIFKCERVAELVVTLLVVSLGGEVGLAPVTGRGVRPAQARFELAAARNEFELKTGARQPDIGGASGRPSTADRERRGFGRAEAGEEGN